MFFSLNCLSYYRFETVRGNIICSSPESLWAQHAIKIIERGLKPIYSEPSTKTATKTAPTITSTTLTPTTNYVSQFEVEQTHSSIKPPAKSSPLPKTSTTMTTHQKAHTNRRPVPQDTSPHTTKNHRDRRVLTKDTMSKSVTTVKWGSYSEQGWQTVTTQGCGIDEELSVSTEDNTHAPYSELRQLTVARLRFIIFFIFINLSIIFSIRKYSGKTSK